MTSTPHSAAGDADAAVAAVTHWVEKTAVPAHPSISDISRKLEDAAISAIAPSVVAELRSIDANYDRRSKVLLAEVAERLDRDDDQAVTPEYQSTTPDIVAVITATVGAGLILPGDRGQLLVGLSFGALAATVLMSVAILIHLVAVVMRRSARRRVGRGWAGPIVTAVVAVLEALWIGFRQNRDPAEGPIVAYITVILVCSAVAALIFVGAGLARRRTLRLERTHEQKRQAVVQDLVDQLAELRVESVGAANSILAQLSEDELERVDIAVKSGIRMTERKGLGFRPARAMRKSERGELRYIAGF